MPINFVRFWKPTQSYFHLAVGIAMLCVVALSGCQRFQKTILIEDDAMAHLAMTNEIRMLDMDAPAQASGFYEKHPFYQSGALPAGAYDSKVKPVNTLLMPTLLIAHKDMPAEVVYTILKRIYTAEGLQALQAATGGAAASTTVENAPTLLSFRYTREPTSFGKNRESPFLKKRCRTNKDPSLET